VSGGGACLVACAGQERGRESSAEGASERGEVGEQRATSKGARTQERGRRTHGRGCVHGEGRGREVGDRLTGGVRRTERERERERERADARARGTAPTELAHWAAGGRERRQRACKTG
jgi:hypothetical protein